MPIDPVTGAYIAVESGRAVANMFGAKNAADASADAARIQSEAALEAAGMLRDAQREALGFQRDVYNQGRADQQPWIGAGQGAVSKLAHLMGIPMGGGGFTPLAAPAAAPRGTRSAPDFDADLEPSTGRRGGGTSAEAEGWLPAPRAREFGQRAAAYRWPGQFAAPEDRKELFMRPHRSFRRQVLIQSPEGEVQPVDPQEVELFVKAGGKVVG